MAGSRASRTALFVIVLVAALAAAAWRVGWLSAGNGPLPVTQVPSQLPTRGVQLEDGQIVLRPWETPHSGAMSASQAIAAARRHSSFPWMRSVEFSLPSTALKAEVTFRNRGPIGSRSMCDCVIHHVPVWLVTFTSSSPLNLDNDGIRTYYVTQFSEGVDPTTGKSVLGFTTPFPCRYANPGSSLASCEHPDTLQWEAKQRLGDGSPTILRTETVRDLGGSARTVATLRGHFKTLSTCRAPAPVYQRRCAGPKASYAWLGSGDMGYGLTSASQLAAISAAQHASPLFRIFPDFTFRAALCAIPIGYVTVPIAAACRTTLSAPRTVTFQVRWPVYVPAQTNPHRVGWIVTLDRNNHVRSIRQFGNLLPQLAAGNS